MTATQSVKIWKCSPVKEAGVTIEKLALSNDFPGLFILFIISSSRENYKQSLYIFHLDNQQFNYKQIKTVSLLDLKWNSNNWAQKN